MQALFLGNHPAIDFLNTAYAPNGEPIEAIGDGRELLGWMVSAGVLDPSEATRLPRRLGAKAIDAAAAEARRLREWARSWLERWRSAPDGDYQEEVAELNRLLRATPRRSEVIGTAEGLRMVERASVESADGLVSLLATQIAALITGEDPELIRQCAGPGCTMLFLDRSRAHRRVFCSPTVCGNRAKVAAFRKRQRE